ncbi:MAG: 1,2-diacylglycerol 3-beta-glucosyltransferase [Acidimicrobiaceae bacterium]|nr:1,2-diacylglycerol 3-beta-glucosyltransferase [Acidimicrobiaceae bacterium]
MTILVSLLIVFTMSYTTAAFVHSRRRRTAPLPTPDGLFFVFLVPCLNEAVVIGRTIERLLALPEDNFAVLVIDDGSDDGTARIAASYDPDRVWVLRRSLPDARQGKGQALNDAYRLLRDSALLDGHRPEDVVVAVFDADGRIAPNSLYEVGPFFRDPKAGAVQIGVRMHNADVSLLTRMQDLEFVAFTEIFQRARQRVGSVGLGGNGQFVRLTGLMALGDAPWTDCLTEDLDLGIRLLLAGWTNNFCPTAHVSQQAVTSVRRLVRQRSRWFQGHLQCWKLIPSVLSQSRLRREQTNDLVYHLASPSLVLLLSPGVVAFCLAFAGLMVTQPMATMRAFGANHGLPLALAYVLAFGMAPFYGFVYWLRDRKTPLWKAIGYAHLFSLYGYLWFPAGWMAVWRILRRKRGWAKTVRTAEDPPTVGTPAPAPATALAADASEPPLVGTAPSH